ncbi:P-loop containing nucleoside triphosphate hydrolase protein [Dendryphion nanum]|uniref:P-loop containing nucleoside triphosphate hydrolase protein n=1 Tax=Dendryphion nanum TaxID=256645 RepID=A0A9P9IFK7_9PLEO|nr:P-loop containing nucleoside triphosphate hydrolase protein [Dendryphion nanum]
MTDLLDAVPDFDTKPYGELLHSLDKAAITTADLLTLEPQDVGKRVLRPPSEVKRLVDAITATLHGHLGFGGEEDVAATNSFLATSGNVRDAPGPSWPSISTLDEKLDVALGGGLPTGYLVEVTGESGAGKTQLLLTLLLASQLPAPHGLSKSAVYISTEAALSTNRLNQLLSAHPLLATLDPKDRPSLSRILSIQTPDLESQDHILRYQLPVAIQKHGVGLVIIDSVAANYRAEFEKQGARDGAASMAKRGGQLVKLGAFLRNLARTEGIAIVVANQVADRFTRMHLTYPSNLPSRSTSSNSQGTDSAHAQQVHSQGSAATTLMPPPFSSTQESVLTSEDPLSLDHQQRWFTGWGDDQFVSPENLKTPSLGLVWTNQLACRIALIKIPVYASPSPMIIVDGKEQWNEEENHLIKWRRWFKVVFAPWAPASEGQGIEFELQKSGMKHVTIEK